MSMTHCRFCDLTFRGLYTNCPKCGKWLPPMDIAPGVDIEPDGEYELAEHHAVKGNQ